MTKNPTELDDTPEPEDGRAAERLRDLMMGRFPANTAAESGELAPEGDEPSEQTTTPRGKREPTEE
jgi:hypothetical protein